MCSRCVDCFNRDEAEDLSGDVASCLFQPKNVKTRGEVTVGTLPSKFTFLTRNRHCQFARTAGVELQTKIGIGGVNDEVDRFNLNTARAFVGRHVNLHLRDGSVLVNVFITDAKREDVNGRPAVFYVAKPQVRPLTVLLREVEWMDQVDSFVVA